MPFKKFFPFKKASTTDEAKNSMLVVTTRGTLKKKSSLQDLEERGYAVKDILGEGSHCKVRASSYEGQKLAVKVISRMSQSVEFQSKFLPREIEILSKVKHENIVRVHKIFDYPYHIYIFMERIDGGDLLQKIQTCGRMLDEEASFYFSQMLNAIQYLHSQNIAHRDLKCENFMVTDNDVVKLIDFGLSRSAVDDKGKRQLCQTFCGSIAYAAPEILQGRPYNPMMYDAWSLGCILFKMMTGEMPFEGINVTRMVSTQLKKQFMYPTTFEVGSSVKGLIAGMLEPDVTKRFSVRMISQNEWVQSGKKRFEVKDDISNDSELPGTGSRLTGTQANYIHFINLNHKPS